MRKNIAIASLTALIGVTAAATAGALLAGNGPTNGPQKTAVHERLLPSLGAQPDTTSPNWKSLSDDVGVLLRHDDRLGLRGRLFVRSEGVWWPVALDGAADLTGAIPLK